MTASVWEVIAETPWWFYVFCFFFLKISLEATKARTVPVKSLALMPAIFIPFSLLGIYFNVTINFNNVLIWVGSLLLGLLLGFLQCRLFRIKAIKNEDKLYFPGSWTMLISIIVFIIVIYYHGFHFTIDLDTFKQPKYARILLSLYGLFAGVFIGRWYYSMRCVKYGPFVTSV